MIRRLLSLVVGVLAQWVLFLAISTGFFQMTAYEMITSAQGGSDAFYQVCIAALLPAAVICFILSRLPVIKRLWVNIGALALAAVILLLSLLFFGTGSLATVA